jgi:hypothetical protein
VKPRAALRRISSAATTGSASQASWHGIMRPGQVPAQTSSSQSLKARSDASPSSRSFMRRKRQPREPERRGGKAQGRLDADRVHVAHALADVPDRGMQLVEVDGAEVALARLPAADAVGPEQGHALVLEDPVVDPGRVALDAGRARLEPRGEASFEQVGRLDQMVVDGHDPIAQLRRRQLAAPDQRSLRPRVFQDLFEQVCHGRVSVPVPETSSRCHRGKQQPGRPAWWPPNSPILGMPGGTVRRSRSRPW